MWKRSWYKFERTWKCVRRVEMKTKVQVDSGIVAFDALNRVKFILWLPASWASTAVVFAPIILSRRINNFLNVIQRGEVMMMLWILYLSFIAATLYSDASTQQPLRETYKYEFENATYAAFHEKYATALMNTRRDQIRRDTKLTPPLEKLLW